MRVIVNPKYKKLKSFINELPQKFDTSGESIYKGRNEIKVFDCDGIKLNVKSFKIPHLINKVAYAWLRGSKAKHSFEYGMRLIHLGVETPEPVAYIEIRKNGLLYSSYYICLHHMYDYTIREIVLGEREYEKELIEKFAEFTYNKHQAGVLHLDYSPGNILISEKQNQYKFSIVDINRIRFKEVTPQMGLNNLAKLWAEENFLIGLAKEYAKLSGLKDEVAVDLLLKYDHQHKEKKLRKKRIKEFIRNGK
ncbi:lipopolysaccharide kinase InaA family protein [Marinifilum flexuosum]|jgi:hypothetical protein|uniref:lipopolysaccharide kinase InaA family protein n=1 Tax=Marinifilum flexuosum TaxID=1117708 RepID=UPI0024949CA0|nr:lipopolysaccharide kinase InaA family protein [Marinifilum flexuosum]